MLWTFLHLTSQIDCGCYDKVWIGSSDFDLRIKSANVELCGGHSLLSDQEAFTNSAYLWERPTCQRRAVWGELAIPHTLIKINTQVSELRKGISLHGVLILVFELLPSFCQL
jgi:hypothetical protein